jgi:hypothetical protein
MRSLTLAADVSADPAHVFTTLSTTEGQRAFWTADCDVSLSQARFGFPEAPTDLKVEVTTEPSKLVRMHVTTGFAFWPGTTWEWELGSPARAETGTGVLFRHYGFDESYRDFDLGHTAYIWALILERLVAYHATGTAQPFFSAPA